MSDSGRGFGLDSGFIDHFNIQLVTTLNNRVIANFHTLQIARAHKLVLSASYSLHQTSPGNGSNNGYSSSAVLKSSLNGASLPTKYLPCNWLAAISHQPPGLLFAASLIKWILSSQAGVLVIWPLRMDRVENTVPGVPLLFHAYPLPRKRVY
jgi:hypothetical protein